MIEATKIAIGRLRAHGENSNVMSKAGMKALERNIARSGRYPALVVRPIGDEGADGEAEDDGRAEPGCYEVLDGHHRLAVLARLGYERVRCDVWAGVDDDEARLLLATLNRLEGADDPIKRGKLLARLLERREGTDVAGLLPESPDRLERLLALAREDRPSVRLLDRGRTGGGNAGGDVEGRTGLGRRGLTLFIPSEAYGEVRRRLREIDDDPGVALCRVLGIGRAEKREETG